VMVVAAAVFVLTLVALGAIVSSALFLFLMLWLLNRSHLVLNIAISLGLPLGLYLLFQSLLNAGLPNGILPRF
jgi:putative tricarboxylic transport membrane protein